jgi:selenocysteine lyase/cysteine desulfurase
LRPLHHLKEQGIIDLDLAPFDREGFIDPRTIAERINARTRFVIVTHGSNVLGTVQPVGEIGEVCRKTRVPLLLDATQTAGLLPIDMQALGVSALAFTGHKSLLGPTGIGGLVLRHDLDVLTTRFGGTGSDSLSLMHSKNYPQRLEAGTINVMGVFGLASGLRYLEKRGAENVYAQEMGLTRRFIDGLASVPGIQLYCADNLERHLPLFSCNIKGMDPEQISAILDGDFRIAARAGIHCSPLTHISLGTAPKGAVRFSLGPFSRLDEIDKAIEAMETISQAK